MASDVVLYEVDDGVAVITLNRPDRLNAWTGELGQAYFDRLDEAVADPEVGAIVVTGAGRGFCAGADMAVLQGMGGGGGVEDDRRPMSHPYRVPKLTVAAINGACAGLGLVQALYLDVRFAAEGAKLTSAFPQRGLIAEYGSSWLLARLVGSARAVDILASSRVILGSEAAELGLVNRAVPAGDLLDVAVTYARHVARTCSPASVATIKWQLEQDAMATFDQAEERAKQVMARSLAGPDFKEGLASYLEKRPAAFPPLGAGSPSGPFPGSD
jgi:enoyl-CoA hydratase/carnithine racemase